MESTQLSTFYQSVTHWPANETELAMVSEKLCRMLDVSFVSMQRLYGVEKISSCFGVDVAPASSDLMDEFTRQKIEQAEKYFFGITGSSPQVKQLQLSGESVPWNISEKISSVAIVNISGESRMSLTGSRYSRQRRDYGWIVVGSPKTLGKMDEVLLLAAAQRLSALAEVSAYESAIQLRGQFLSIASHELKTPLTSIYGILQLQERMLRKMSGETPQKNDERQESYLKMVIRQVKRLNELIDALLDVSRIQNNRFMVEPSDTDVAALVRDTVSSRLAVISHEAGVKVESDVPTILNAWVDPVRMEEVVTNLVMNAIRFSPEGGVVWIRVREDNGIMRLSVRDQGPSVPDEDRERIFQPFERAQRTARFGGLGLGLFISRQIAQLHGGNVSLIESLPGKGNLFEASFPLRSPNVVSASA